LKAGLSVSATLIADGGEQPDDPALVGGEDLNRHFLIEINAADRFLLDRKDIFPGRLDLDGSELRVAQVHAIGRGRSAGSARGRQIGFLGVGMRGRFVKSRARSVVGMREIRADDDDKERRRDRCDHEGVLILVGPHGSRFNSETPPRWPLLVSRSTVINHSRPSSNGASGALIVAIDSFIRSRREKLVALPTHHKVPTVLPMDTHHDIPAAPE
jgi:hypothetical protein